jgi:hypothetical protein
MTVWGFDLGVRSLYAARIEGGSLDLFSCKLVIHKQDRWEELYALAQWIKGLGIDGPSFIEEPPLAGSRNLQTFLHLAQVSGVVSAAARPSTLVPVSSWKLGTIGRGNATKDQVADWLRARHASWYALCGGDQNSIDATCIGLYGLGTSGLGAQ